jgi:protein gp37
VSENSNIQWTDATWNPVVGCDKTSPGCLHCYAISDAWRMAHNPNPKISSVYAGLTHKLPNGIIDWTGVVRLVRDRLSIPVQTGKPQRYFVNSMSDLFHETLPFADVDEVVAAMILAKANGRQHIFQTLTKRDERLYAYMSSRSEDHELLFNAADRAFGEETAIAVANSINGTLGEGRNAMWPPSNAWWGVSVENRKHGLPRVDSLRDTPAALRFLSIEPLLEDIGEINLRGISWVIVGGESGSQPRALNPEWVMSIIEQCAAAGVPCFVKQLGARITGDDKLFRTIHQWITPDGRRHLAPIVGSLVGVRPSPTVDFALCNRHGGEPGEWPESLRVREFPEVSQ